jgi:hypothetical protein
MMLGRRIDGNAHEGEREAVSSRQAFANTFVPGDPDMPRGKAKHDPSNPNASTGAASKMDAVRKALANLGYDAKPPALDEFIRDKYGMEIAHNMISSYKSQLKSKPRRGGKGGRRGRPPATPTVGKDFGGNVSLRDLQEVKTLAGRLGISKLRKLVEVLA